MKKQSANSNLCVANSKWCGPSFFGIYIFQIIYEWMVFSKFTIEIYLLILFFYLLIYIYLLKIFFKNAQVGLSTLLFHQFLKAPYLKIYVLHLNFV